MNNPKAELIRAWTPIAFGVIGGAIIVSGIFAPGLTSEQRAYAIGAGGTAIGAGSGIAKQTGEASAEAETNVNVAKDS